eukprot:CAMPEP_0198155244 /NCGR_PEP_ID=MMETSP1443-20131203/69036_1 /TAXON_ID=186043 /ORGANISM="Entomoneis sp., Strain CCMP2396" /LENGTH=584 /DNA_ID=CAMNT_0043821987 /DNA_START=119 /DNA_END=1873 /DNA_ORIENTATION=-
MEGSPRAMAMIEFVGTFASLSGSPPESLSDLSDGVTLFEALSEIAPGYFDPTTIARHLGDNWALKSSNLRKLIRNLEDYYHEGLFKDSDFAAIPMTAIAKESDEVGIGILVELVAAASVTCADKGTYVQRIMGMSTDNQVEMKSILEQSLGKLTDYIDDDDEGDENELVFDDDEEEEQHHAEEIAVAPVSMFGGHHVNDGMEEDLADAQREIGQLKSQIKVQDQDNERAQSKLRAVVEDLQDRLVKRQDDLIQLEEDLRATTTELEDSKAKLNETNVKTSQLADDLDVANAKAQQLHRAEATVLAYKKRLEGMGEMNQQMSDLEDQSANYLRQIMELETQVKKSNALTKQVHELEEQIKSLEKEKATMTNSSANAVAEIDELKSALNSADRAKKQYEEELAELRAKAEVLGEDGSSEAPVASLAASTSTAADKEKWTRMQIQMEQLQKQVDQLNKIVATQKMELAAVTTATAAVTSTAASSSDSDEVKQLKRELELKNKEIAKISSDKDKLETYTKRTLAKFQEKYLVALQECKAKLKEKQDKIESLESRSASERTAQKREERLLSSTIYELGLAIMQNRLKER